MKHHPVGIRALATANPPLYVTQAEAFGHYDSLFELAEAERELYRKLLIDGPIRGRYVGMDSPGEAVECDADALNRRYLKYARRIGAEAARRALASAGVAPGEVGGLVVNSCTGYLCPGLCSYIVEDVGLPGSVQYADLMGMGCGGALPNLSVAAGMVAAGRGPVLSLAVEICTATLFMGEDPGLIVSNAIFGDGAAATLLVSANGDAERDPVLSDFESGLFPRHRADLQYRLEDHRLRNVLGPRVPAIGAKTVGEVTRRLLRRNGLGMDRIRHWAVHPGGTAVLDAVTRGLGLEREDLRHSYAVFEEYGNMSSPSVMFVLKRILEHDRPAPGEYGLLLAFGAGFSAFAILVRF